jgi:hypothetical protein
MVVAQDLAALLQHLRVQGGRLRRPPLGPTMSFIRGYAARNWLWEDTRPSLRPRSWLCNHLKPTRAVVSRARRRQMWPDCYGPRASANIYSLKAIFWQSRTLPIFIQFLWKKHELIANHSFLKFHPSEFWKYFSFMCEIMLNRNTLKLPQFLKYSFLNTSYILLKEVIKILKSGISRKND